MLRRIMIPAVTIAVLALMGYLLYSPPAFLDALSGATERLKGEETELVGSYVFGMNTERVSAAHTRDSVRAFLEGEQGVINDTTGTLHIAVQADDKPLNEWVDGLVERLNARGIRAKKHGYSALMLRSHLLGGAYEAFVTTRGFMDMDLLKGLDAVPMDSAAMNALLVSVEG